MDEVFVIIGFYADHSGCKLLGIYETLEEAEDRHHIVACCGAVITTRVVKMKVGAADPQEVF